MVAVKVVTGVLRDAATQVTEIAAAWQQIVSVIRAAELRDDDYGYLGRDLVAAYRRAVSTILLDLEEGHERINAAAVGLNDVATGYENVDDSYYQQFGYIVQ